MIVPCGGLEIELITDAGEKKALSERILKIESALGINAYRLAALCDISSVTVYRLDGHVKSDSGFSDKLLHKISDKIGVAYDWLRSGEVDDISFSDEERWDDLRKLISSEKSEEVSDRLRQLREEVHISQDELGSLSGTTYMGVSAVETGRYRLTKQMAKKIEIAMWKEGYPFYGSDWLLTGDERNKQYPVGELMIEWLKDHEDVRKKIWEMMNE